MTTEGTKTSVAYLTLEANVECPHCKEDIDLYEDSDFKEVYFFNSEGELRPFFSIPDLIRGAEFTVKCNCGETFMLDDYELL